MAKRLFDEEGNEVKGVKVKKPFYKKWWFIALVVVIIIGAIGGDDEDSVATDTSEPEIEEVVAEDVDTVEEEVEPEEVVEEKTEEVEETEVSDSTEEEEERELIILSAESIAIENFEGVAEVHYSEEENAMVFLPIDEDFTMALGMIETGLLDKSNWHSLRDNFVEYSGILSEFTGDESILVYMANPANPDRYILVANNGQVIYDVFE